MLYLGIDQHARQLMISLRDGSGDVLQARQVSTRPEKIQAFLTKLTKERLRDDELLFAVVEAFGFHLHDPWFVNKIDRKSSAFPPLIAARNLAGFYVLVSATLFLCYSLPNGLRIAHDFRSFAQKQPRLDRTPTETQKSFF